MQYISCIFAGRVDFTRLTPKGTLALAVICDFRRCGCIHALLTMGTFFSTPDSVNPGRAAADSSFGGQQDTSYARG